MQTPYGQMPLRPFNPRAALINGNGDGGLSGNGILGDPAKLGSPPKTSTSDGQKKVDDATREAMDADKEKFAQEKIAQSAAAQAQKLLGDLAKAYQTQGVY